MVTQYLQTYIVTYRNGDVFMATVSAINTVAGKAAADLACRWTRGDPKEQAWDTCAFPRAENAVEGVARLSPAISPLKMVEEIRLSIEADDSGCRILTPDAMTQLDEMAAGTRETLDLESEDSN